MTKCITNMTLIEEAEKHYYDEEDEFPLDYTAALRSNCAMKMSDANDDADARAHGWPVTLHRVHFSFPIDLANLRRATL